jgi:DNA-binding GntR family transcriptional regulator
LSELDTLLDEMAGLRLPEDVPRLIAIDLQFHRLLVQGADAPHIIELWASLNGKMSALILSSIEHHHASIDDVVTLHRALVDAVRSGDVTVAREAVLLHYVGNDDGRPGDTNVSLADMAEITRSLARQAGLPTNDETP